MAKTNWQLNDTVLPSDLNSIGQDINDLQDANNESAVDYVRQPAFANTTGTAGSYVVTLDPPPTSIPEGFGITIVPHINNTINPTININGLGAIDMYDQRGNTLTAGKLLAGKPYTFRKVGADFLADSSGGSGNAVAGDIRAGKTATTDNGDVIGTLPVRTGGTVTPSTVNQTKQAGIYDTDIVVQGDADLIAGNIKSGINLFGIVGNYLGKGIVVYSVPSSSVFLPQGTSVQLPLPPNMDFIYGCYIQGSGSGISGHACGIYFQDSVGKSSSNISGNNTLSVVINQSGRCNVTNSSSSGLSIGYAMIGREI
ncbi:hypothetical protein J2Z32_003458 [Paenibacillus turicensis]|uniref:Uncharacterized protein n=1 Tax=Paenibacillus turicensis TaxID=160487 RepID=A0ABS4FWF8_9BACL|nr:hypothetical protein [Paenibacillus turicensis]MBP1906794.1 hypothetical protein [Paenibacillus turicensis]